MPPVPAKLTARLVQMTDGQKLDAILTMLVRIERKLDAGRAPAAGGPTIASDSDLDSKHGDEVIKHNPKRWTGESFVGKRMSACPPDFLDVFAEAKDYGAGKDAEKVVALEREVEAITDPKAKRSKIVALDKARQGVKWNRIHAARARGWARRLRAGWTPPAPSKQEQPPPEEPPPASGADFDDVGDEQEPDEEMETM